MMSFTQSSIAREAVREPGPDSQEVHREQSLR